MRKLLLSIAFITGTLLISCISCSKEESTPVINSGDDPNFKIEAAANAQLSSFTKKVLVFEIPIYAVAAVEDVKLLHAANIMAQYLDNNEDGEIDNPAVQNAMKINNAFMVMWKKESDLDNVEVPDNAMGQDLGNDETRPVWHTNEKLGEFDAALEEVWHIITFAGYSSAYPDIFGEQAGTSLTNALDIARGGNFVSVPNEYPENAWFTYDDETCDYNCMATEYFYWAMTSILGAQENRLDEIGHEWKLNTKEKVKNTDVAIFELLTNPEYKLPTVLPDGSYKH